VAPNNTKQTITCNAERVTMTKKVITFEDYDLQGHYFFEEKIG